jgi:hypothetical protein
VVLFFKEFLRILGHFEQIFDAAEFTPHSLLVEFGWSIFTSLLDHLLQLFLGFIFRAFSFDNHPSACRLSLLIKEADYISGIKEKVAIVILDVLYFASIFNASIIENLKLARCKSLSHQATL